MVAYICRVASQVFPYLTDCAPLGHGPTHPYVDEMSKASHLINVGVMPYEPDTVNGVVDIMEELQRSVPQKAGSMIPAVCHGDGKSFQLMAIAQRDRVRGQSPMERLEGLVPGVQEFHLEGVLMGVSLHFVMMLFTALCQHDSYSSTALSIEYCMNPILGNKQHLFFKDIYKDHFSPSTFRQPCTLAHLKQVFGHKGVSSTHIMGNYAYNKDFLQVL